MRVDELRFRLADEVGAAALIGAFIVSAGHHALR
jgi:hypothetical protein